MGDLLATRIKQARNLAGLTQEQLARKLGVSLSTAVRYEHGRSGVSYTRLRQIAKHTRQPLDFFVETAGKDRA